MILPLCSRSGRSKLAQPYGWQNHEEAKSWEIPMCNAGRGGLKWPFWRRVSEWLFPDAELAENRVQQVFGGGFTHDFPHRLGGDPQVHRY
jgi:hypothetical protein